MVATCMRVCASAANEAILAPTTKRQVRGLMLPALGLCRFSGDRIDFCSSGFFFALVIAITLSAFTALVTFVISVPEDILDGSSTLLIVAMIRLWITGIF